MSARNTKTSKVGTSYIEKYLKTAIANGTLQVVNSTGDALYFIQGQGIQDNVKVNLPVLSGDDTIAFQNFNNEFGGIQTFAKGLVTQGGLLVLPDPNGILEDDITLSDGLNIVTGIGQGSSIATTPNQKVGFFGNSPITQPGVTVPATSTTMVQDIWNALVNLGLLSPAAASAIFSLTGGGGSGVLPSQIGNRYGLFQGSSTTPAGNGLLSQLTTTTGTGTIATTFINNRPATNTPSGATSGNFGGFRSTNPIFTSGLDPTLTFKVAMSTNSLSRLYLGCASSTTITTGFNTALNSISGFMIGFGSGDTAYSVITNNGGATQTNNTTGMPALQTAGTTAIFKLSYNHTTPSLTWSVQTGTSTTTSATITTGLLPANTTQMYVYCTCQTNTTSAVTLTIEDVELSFGSTLDYGAF